MSLIPDIEQQINQQWQDEHIFQRSLEQNQHLPSYVFYDGPPFATGNPHYGHILAGSIKDTLCRHAQFKGFSVNRQAGWDCHGLPIEYEIEKQLGIKNHQQILDYGIANYNQQCRQIVMRCSDYWKQFMTRFGRWIDFDHDYKTMDLDYMQSVWTVFKQLWDQQLVYQSFKVMPYSTACGTPLSNFEANSNYQSVTEESIIVKFKSHQYDFYYLVWTTTPWTLPSNMMLCLHPDLNYTIYRLDNEKFLVTDNLVSEILGVGKKKQLPKNLIKLETYPGKHFQGDTYTPIFDFYSSLNPEFIPQVTCDPFVSDTAGTGIVHLAPAFGEEDYRVCVQNEIIGSKGQGLRCPIDRNGCFIDPLPEYFQGRNVKDCDKDIIEDLKTDQKLFSRLNTTHQYPFCWRSETPLIYRAVPSLFVEVTKLKDQLIANCQQSNWIPDHVQSKRFQNWLENSQDWGISRNRYWGTPIPLWTDDQQQEFICVGSVAELEQLAQLPSGSLTDIHREHVDQITITSPTSGKSLHRVEYVFDCWFESGSMPFASQKYHLNSEINYPADFIAEGLDQTRGWFYTLLIIGTALKQQVPYRHVVVNGLVLAEDGKKMSKRLKNYPDPMEIINKYGADALRFYLLSSPAVKADSLRFKEDGVNDVLKLVLIPLLNSLKFYQEQKTRYDFNNSDSSNLKMIKLNKDSDNQSSSSNQVFDQWILYQLKQFKNQVIDDLDQYILNNLGSKTQHFVNLLNNTYIKLNRDRLKGKIDHLSTFQSLMTLLIVLHNLSIILSSYLPHFSEYLYQNLELTNLPNSTSLKPISVHLLSYQSLNKIEVNYQPAFHQLDLLIEVLELIRQGRNDHKIPNKKPLQRIIICTDEDNYDNLLEGYENYIINEGNILEVNYQKLSDVSEVNLKPNLGQIGSDFKQQSKEIIKYLQSLDQASLQHQLSSNQLNYPLSSNHFNYQHTIKSQEHCIHLLNNNQNILIYLNIEQNETITHNYMAKCLISEIQKYRKDLNLKAWDQIDIVLHYQNSLLLDTVLNQYQAKIKETLQTDIIINPEFKTDYFPFKSIDINEIECQVQIIIK